MPIVDITGLDKAAVLAALHNATRSHGMGAIADIRRDMTVIDAEKIIVARRAFGADQYRFDYVNGRPIKTNITEDSFDPRLFDRDAGEGAAARAIATIPRQVPQTWITSEDDSDQLWERRSGLDLDDDGDIVGGSSL